MQVASSTWRPQSCAVIVVVVMKAVDFSSSCFAARELGRCLAVAAGLTCCRSSCKKVGGGGGGGVRGGGEGGAGGMEGGSTVVEALSPFLTGRMFVRPNILRTLRRTMIRFLMELLVRRIRFGQFKLYFILNWFVMRCKLWPELVADAQQTS